VYPARVVKKTALSSILFGLLACQTQKAPGPKACCDQPEIPSGVAPFRIVADDTTGPSDGEKVLIRAVLGNLKDFRHHSMYGVLHTLYRHAMKRRPFEPIRFEALVYPVDQVVTAAGGSGWMGRIVREQGAVGPRCENRLGYKFDEQAGLTFARLTGRGEEDDPNDTCRLADRKRVARIDDNFKLRPALGLEPTRLAAIVTHPYTEMGKDEYVKQLSLASALREWIHYTAGLFGRAPMVQEVTFVGVHNDAEVVKITVKRDQYLANLANLQEEVASHAAVTVASLGSRMEDGTSAAKEQAVFHAKTYKAALSLLPKGQVSVSPKLK
jgi:hypothetical protein